MQTNVEHSGGKLDLFAGVGGLLGGAVIAYLGYISESAATTEMGIAVLAASAIYLLFRKKLTAPDRPPLSASTSLTLVLNIIFISALAASVFLMQSSLYRPPLYFLLVSIAVAAIAIEILATGDKSPTWLLLLKILLVSFVLRAGVFYEVPGFTGNDAWIHGAMIESWTTSGRITSAVPTLTGGYTGYADFPMMHLTVMATGMITSLDLKNSLFLSVGLFNIVSILFIFLIGQRLLDKRCGLLAALFISVSLPHIASGATLIPTSLGVAIFAMLLFLVLKSSSSAGNALIFIIASAVIVLTHTISAFVAFTALVLILIAPKVSRKLGKVNIEGLNIGYNAVMLFGVMMFARWLYSFYYPSQSFFEAITGWFVRALQVDTQFIGTVVHIASESPLNRVWFLMFISFIVIGSLVWLSARRRNNLRTAIITGALGLSLVTFILPLFNIENFIPGRWVPFIFVIGAVPVAQGILVLSSITKAGAGRAFLMVVIIFAFSMFSINSGSVNTQTPFHEEPIRIGFIQSELSAADTISTKYNGEITTDWDYAELIFRTQTGLAQLTYLDPEIDEEGLIVIRSYISQHPELLEYHWRPGTATLEETTAFFAKFDGSEYDLIYDNGEVKAYLGE